MQVQDIFLDASEFYEEEGYFELQQDEYDFLMSRLMELNTIEKLNSKQRLEIKGIMAIFIYAERCEDVENKGLNRNIIKLFKEVRDEFCGSDEG